MRLPVGYGSLLNKEQKSQANYIAIKPAINFWVNLLFAFSFGLVVTSGLVLSYEKYMNTPEKTYDEATYQRYKALDEKLQTFVKKEKAAATHSVYANDGLAKFIKARPEGVVCRKISFNDAKGEILFTGTTTNIDDAKKMADALDFGPTKEISLKKLDIKDMKDNEAFVTTKDYPDMVKETVKYQNHYLLSNVRYKDDDNFYIETRDKNGNLVTKNNFFNERPGYIIFQILVKDKAAPKKAAANSNSKAVTK